MSGKSSTPDDVTMLRIVNGVAFLLPFGDDAFFSHVNFAGTLIDDRPELGPCWLWTGALTEWGYGLYHIPRTRKNGFAHRYAWEQTNGQIVGDLLVCHHCDRPACVNPSHLWLGTNKQNSDDKWRKGRGVPPPAPSGDGHYRRKRDTPMDYGDGRRSPNARLTADQVREIRRYYAAGGITQAQLAADFGVNQQAIAKIISRQRWAHLDD